MTSILGCGTVGLSVGSGFLKLGHEVVFYDINKRKVEDLRRSGLNTTLHMRDAIGMSQASFICVPTTAKEGRINL